MYGNGLPFWITIKGTDYRVSGKNDVRNLLSKYGIDPREWRAYATRHNALWFWN